MCAGYLPSALSNPIRASRGRIEVFPNRIANHLAWGAGTTAPPKPSAQTQILLASMEEDRKDDEKWVEVMEHLDLLFSRVGDIDNNQQKLEAQAGITTKVIEQMLQDQQMMAKQIEAMGKAVAQLTLNQNNRPPSPASSDTSEDLRFAQHHARNHTYGAQKRGPRVQTQFQSEDRQQSRGYTPKINFPQFDGTDLCLWKDKCEDYIKIMNVPESMWATAASLHMDSTTSRWARAHKLKHGLGTWSEFMNAVQAKFGAYDYQHAINSLLELQQTGSVEE